MNIKDFKMYINSLYLDKYKYYVIGSGSLLMYGVVDEVNDINLLVSDKVFDDLEKVFTLKNSKNFPYVYIINDRLNICKGIVKPQDYMIIEGIPVKKIDEQYNWYLKSGRDKDKDKILKLDNYFNRRRNV